MPDRGLTKQPIQKMSKVIGGGLVALFFALIFAALTVFGVISTTLGHALLLGAWIVGGILIFTEVLPGTKGRRKLVVWRALGLWMALGITILLGDMGIVRWKEHKPITETNGFTILIPINTATPTSPIAIDENPDDPHWKFYRSLWFFVPRGQRLSTEEEQSAFVRRLGQMYVFESVFSMTRERYGVELSGGKTIPINDKAIIPPDLVSSPTADLINELSMHQLLSPNIEMSLKNFPLHMPKGTNVSFVETNDQRSGKPFAYTMRLERPGFFAFDLTVQPMGSSNVGVPPDKFQGSAAKTVKTYSLIIAMHSVIQVKNEDGFEPDKYAAWARDTFAELRRRTSF